MLKYWADRAIECMTSFVYTRPFDSSLKILNLSQKMFLCQNEVRGIPYCFGENIDLLDFGFFCVGSLFRVSGMQKKHQEAAGGIIKARRGDFASWKMYK